MIYKKATIREDGESDKMLKKGKMVVRFDIRYQ